MGVKDFFRPTWWKLILLLILFMITNFSTEFVYNCLFPDGIEIFCSFISVGYSVLYFPITLFHISSTYLVSFIIPIYLYLLVCILVGIFGGLFGLFRKQESQSKNFTQNRYQRANY